MGLRWLVTVSSYSHSIQQSFFDGSILQPFAIKGMCCTFKLSEKLYPIMSRFPVISPEAKVRVFLQGGIVLSKSHLVLYCDLTIH